MDTVFQFIENQLALTNGMFLKLIIPLVSLFSGAVILTIIVFVGWFGLTYGLRRQERARSFFSLLETGLSEGRTPEQTVLQLSRHRIRELGNGLHLVAENVALGQRLGDALDEVPSFLPPQCRALYRAAEATGNLQRALPACRAALRDAASGSLVASNNLMTLLFVSPAGPLLIWMCNIWIIPKFKDIIKDMLPGAAASPSMQFFAWSTAAANITIMVWILYWLWMCVQYGGPWLRRWLDPILHGVRDLLTLWMPWRRWRMQRDFSLMLGLALDVGVPEPKALTLAGQATGNSLFAARVARAGAELERGTRLPDAVTGLDATGEFAWRLRNAAAGQGGFSKALAGWHETLAARAFQREQSVSHCITTALVFMNATMVALMGVGVFTLFVQIIEGI